MTAYRPGQGLNTEAMERLRARRQANDGIADLPAQDESEQWDRLLGEGATKKPRCGICTKPILNQDHAVKMLLCANCTSSTMTDVAPRSRSMACSNSSVRSPTPSTNADSEDLDGSTSNVPVMWWRPHLATRRVEGVIKLKRSQGFAYIENLKISEGLPGDSRNMDFLAQRRDFTGDSWLSCQVGDSVSFSWEIDERKRPVAKSVEWTGHPEATMQYAVKDHEPCGAEQPRGCRPGGLQSAQGCPTDWIPSLRASKGFPQSDEKRACKPGWADAEPLGDIVASAIHDVMEQLHTPGNQGFVWIPKWNEHYSWHLGTLRNFLESHPEKFTVVPLKGKGFRVAVARQTNEKWPWW